MSDIKEINLEEKLRKLIGDKKKEVPKEESKKEEKKEIENEEFDEAQNIPIQSTAIRLDNSISLGPRIESNIQQIQRQDLESNVWESAPKITDTNTNEQLKAEEKYQSAKDFYETGERVRQPTLNDPQRATRIGDWNAAPIQIGNVGRTLNVIDTMQTRTLQGDVEKYEAIKESTDEKSNWRISNRDVTRKYGVNE